MRPEGTVQYNSLSWVKKQLDAVLHDAQTSLSDYIEDNENRAALERCIEHLRLVYGTLQMVEVYGAAMLAEEMELTARAQLEGLIEKPEDVYDVLMRAMLQLPDYLEGLQAGNQDAPITLMPLMNDMRAARKVKLLSESVLFLPDINAVGIEELSLDSSAIEPGRLADEAKRLRTHYQLGLLDLLRNNKHAAGLKRMRAVIDSLQKVTADAAVKRFWMVVSALLEAVSDDALLESNITVKGLFGSIDRQIKLLIDLGEDKFINQFSQELLKNILYYVGTSKSTGSRVSKVKHAYKLDELLADKSSATDLTASMGGINAELFDTVSQGIREDLATVKDTLEIFMQSNDKDVGQLSSIVQQIEKIGDTYGMLGFGAIRQKVLSQRDEMEKIINGESEATEQKVMDIASTLLEAEATLDDYIAGKSGFVDDKDDSARMVPSSEYRKVLAAVVEEGQKNFSEAKEAILVYAAGNSDIGQLETVMQRLEEVRGACMMLSAEPVEKLISGLKEYVHVALQIHHRQPEVNEQDALADVVTSIEYYFEALSEGRPGVDQGLQAGARALSDLIAVVKQYGDVQPSVTDNIESETVAADNTKIKDKLVMADHAETEETEASESKAESVVTPAVSVASAAIPVQHEEYEILSDDADEEIVEIFIEEAVEVLGSLHEYMPKWKNDINDEESLTVVRRNFHTLKGSGRLIGAALIGEFSWKIESLLNRVIDKKIEVSDELLSLMDEVLAVLPQLIEQLRGNREPIPNIYQLMAYAGALAEGRAHDSTVVDEEVSTKVEEVAELESAATESEIDLTLNEVMEVGGDLSDEDEMLLDALNEVEDEVTLEAPTETDEVLLDVMDHDFGEEEILFDTTNEVEDEITLEAPTETDEVLLNVTDQDSDEETMLFDVSDDLSETVEITDIDKEVPVDEFETIDLTVEESKADNDTIEAVDVDGLDSFETSMEDLSLDEAENDFVIEIDESDELDEVEEVSGLQMDPMLFQIYYDESCGHLQVVTDALAKHESGTQKLEANKDLIRALHTLFGSARTAEIEAIAEICGAIEKYVVAREDAEEALIPDNVVRIIAEVMNNVEAMLEKLKAGSMPEPNKALLDKINKAVQDELQRQLQQSSSAHEVIAQDATQEAASAEEKKGSAENQGTLYTYGDVDDDLIDIFLEEAEELLEDCESTLSKLRENEDDAASINELQRHMHTLKGGARMATLTPVGDLTHVLESMVISLSENKIEAGKEFFDVLHESLDTLNTMLGSVKQRQAIKSADGLVKRIEAIIRGETIEQPAIDQRVVERFDVEVDELHDTDIEEHLPDEIVSLDIQQQMPEMVSAISTERVEDPHRRKSDEIEKKPHWGERATDVNFKDSQEQVRVRADLLNNLVNYAGEVNIHHARMGKQITDIGFNLKELNQTVIRLKEQLRKLEIETEIQIRSNYEKESDDYDENFDPLEMDRYSTLQQLARSLSETASDVDSIKDILSDIVGDSETLLLQESRISTDLQEGLMRTRMVRFGGMSTRLRRIVRQTTRELGKEVEVEIVGEEQEVDRTILDRVVAPLEHMLRNAVAHGIELPKDRLAAGKPEVGNIKITVGRQGTDVIVKVEDDGAGINADAIRRKAIKQGLLEEESVLTDRDVLQFILKSGFSTAEEVTQVAGRGVGMDVVDSEIKQLGGVLEIDTTRGKGTSFKVRLPLTLAINQALLVDAGDNIYAVPLASIEGVVRITGTELQGFYDSGELEYEFNNINYELKHLAFLLTGQQPNYADQGQLFPVLLVHVGDQYFALHVDDLLGRREIVIKPVGAQISTVRGIAGATILADGRVVLILEMSALVVGESLFKEVVTEEPVAEVVEETEPTIMVVDDSITIRKVTARILERHGMKVILATDGVDATSKLQEDIPDLMLLDIEMPKMDGFELATYMRNEERLKEIPIIMITSRTGTKHKERAKEIGVEQYLGKPFQEEELMKNIKVLLELAR
ncbi:MAG: Hpt domain-containing protein [Gammaproteobacteria bacterium]|nr:Hpt domain-containing protein [Gammaproteobacteria bacterium]